TASRPRFRQSGGGPAAPIRFSAGGRRASSPHILCRGACRRLGSRGGPSSLSSPQRVDGLAIAVVARECDFVSVSVEQVLVAVFDVALRFDGGGTGFDRLKLFAGDLLYHLSTP